MDQVPPPDATLDLGTEPGSALEFDGEAFRAAVRAGLAQANRCEGVPHERVREWLLAFSRGERRPVPLADADGTEPT